MIKTKGNNKKMMTSCVTTYQILNGKIKNKSKKKRCELTRANL
jgi:hypothetical protein